MRIIIFALFSICGLCAAEIDNAKKAPENLVKGLKCPVNEKSSCGSSYCLNEVKPDMFAEYEGRKVYFCCEGCVEAFKKDPKSYLSFVKAQWKKLDAK